MSVFAIEPGQRWLFCFAHPDDEIAIAAFIRRLIIGGAVVEMMWIHSDEEREWEARCAAKEIGAASDCLQFFEFPDNRFIEKIGAITAKIESRIQTFEPDRIVCAAFEQGHLDHDALHVAVRCAAGGLPVYEFPEYAPFTPFVKVIAEFCDGDPGEAIKLSDEEIQWKAKVISLYQSQALPKLLMWRRIQDALVGREPVWMKFERLRVARAYDFTQPVRPDWIAHNLHAKKQWAKWMRQAAEQTAVNAL